MAIDVVSVCSDSISSSSPNASFIIFAAFFTAYIGIDALISARVINRQIQEYRKDNTTKYKDMPLVTAQ
tara:strand:- start:969 stop:1175 length:207 start_codon:yes stop_codon:yes gene_type:complete